MTTLDCRAVARKDDDYERRRGLLRSGSQRRRMTGDDAKKRKARENEGQNAQTQIALDAGMV